MTFSKEQYLNSSLIQNYLPHIIQTSDKFHRDNQVRFLSYIKQYDNGKSIELCTNIDWMEHSVANFNTDKFVMPRLNIGMNFWSKINSSNIQEMILQAKQRFNIDAVVEFVYRDNIQNCFHMYSFYADTLQANKAPTFYLRNKAKLLRLVASLNNQSYQYFSEDAENEIAIQVMGYQIKKNQIDSIKGFTDLLEEKLYYKLTDYELEIITLYGAGGFTAKQIADSLNKSPKTIEYHIGQIRNKTNLKDRRAMNAYVREKGWDKLVNFYSDLSTSEIN